MCYKKHIKISEQLDIWLKSYAFLNVGNSLEETKTSSRNMCYIAACKLK